MTTIEELIEMAEDLLSCFKKKGHWYCTRTNNGKWEEVDEDLNHYLTELDDAVRGQAE